MSSARGSFWAGVKDVAPLAPAALAFGLVIGGAVTQAGFGLAESVALSVGVYGAAAQLAAVQLWDAGAPLLVVVGTGLVINARFIVYSASLAPVLGPTTWLGAAIQGYLIRDGAYALTMTRALPSPTLDTRAYYAGAAFTDWAMWLAATSAGALGAAYVPAGLSFDFIVPLVFVALLAGALTTRVDLEAAAVAAIASAVMVPALPLQTGLLASMAAGVGWAFIRGPSEEVRADE